MSSGLSLENEAEAKSGGVGRVLGIIAGAVLIGFCSLALCISGFVYVIIRTTQPPVDAARSFLEAVADGNSDFAYALLADGVRSEYRDAGALVASMRERGISPAQVGTFSSRRVNGGSARVRAAVTMQDGTTGDVYVTLAYNRSLERWQVTGFTREYIE